MSVTIKFRSSGNSRGAQQKWRVLGVRLGIESGVRIHDSAHVVLLAETIKRCRGREGHVGPVENVLVVQDRVEEPNKEDETTENVGRRPPRSGHGVSDTGNDSPIECKHAHSHTLNDTVSSILGGSRMT